VSRSRRAIAALSILVLVVSACGNSGDDDDARTGATADGGDDGGPSGEEERDTFVEITGVPGVTDDEIGYAVIGTKSGNPLGTCIFDCYLDGIEAYFAFRNSEGGIFGRDLVVSQELDDGLANNQARSLEVVSGDDAFGAFQATLIASGYGDLDAAGIPTYGWGIHATEAAGRQAIFPSTVIRCSDCLGKTIPWEVKETGATRVAALGYGVSENSKVCTNTIADAIELYSDDIGAEIAYVNDELPFGLGGGAGTVVTAMKDADVDFIATCMDLNGMKSLAQELDRQGMGDVTLHHPNTYDQAFVTEAGDLFEGDFVGVGFRPFEADQEGTALADFQEWMEETDGQVTELAMHGWINASLAFEGLLAAGPEFDREKVVAATNSLTEFDAGGLIEPTDWTVAHTPYTNDDRPDDDVECTALVRIVDGTFETVAPPDKPWLCFPTGEEFGEPEPTSFG
jgi:hypothetical protein